MFETMVYYTMAEHLWGMTFEPPIGGPGYTRLMSHHRKPYKTLDGYIAILPYLDAHWETLLQALGPSGAARRTRASRPCRTASRTSTTPTRKPAKIMLTRTTGEWLDLFGETSVPTNVVNTLRGPHGRSAPERRRFLAGSAIIPPRAACA